MVVITCIHKMICSNCISILNNCQACIIFLHDCASIFLLVFYALGLTFEFALVLFLATYVLFTCLPKHLRYLHMKNDSLGEAIAFKLDS